MGTKRKLRLAGLTALAVVLVVGLTAGLLTGCRSKGPEHGLASNTEAGGTPSPGISTAKPPAQASPSTPVSSPPGSSSAGPTSQTSPSTPVSSSPVTSQAPTPSQIEPSIPAPFQVQPSNPGPSGIFPASSPASTPDPGELVELTDLDDTFVIDLRYATEDNFTVQKIYSQSRCFLVRGTAEKLIAANRELAEMGYRLKIWDAYRPPSAQRALWEVFPDPAFVANPENGSIHTRGAAVDVTLVDEEGNELPMPTGFDDFSEKAAISYDGCTEEQARNRDLLAEVMVRNGFVRIQSEWWHFVDSQASSYPMLDVEFEEIDQSHPE
jgi:D-alanyl-D-alanine dipeptidase